MVGDRWLVTGVVSREDEITREGAITGEDDVLRLAMVPYRRLWLGMVTYRYTMVTS